MASTGDIHAGCLPCWMMVIAIVLLVCDSIVLADQLSEYDVLIRWNFLHTDFHASRTL